MASQPKQLKSILARKKLHELLDEKQEPFMLDVYLFEHGFGFKDQLEIGGCCSLKRNLNVKKKNHGLPMCSKVLKMIVKRINDSSWKVQNQISCVKRGKQEGNDSSVMKDIPAAFECDGVSSSFGSYDVFDSFLNSSDNEEESSSSYSSSSTKNSSSSDHSFKALKFPNLNEKEQELGDVKQWSPMSVLDMRIDELIALSKSHFSGPNFRTSDDEVAEETLLKIQSLWETIAQIIRDKHGLDMKELQEAFGSPSCLHEYVQRKRKLITDYLREVVEENHQYSQQLHTDFATSAEMICDQILRWSRKSRTDIDMFNITTKMVESEISSREKMGCEIETDDVVCKIETAVFEDIVSEIALDLLLC